MSGNNNGRIEVGYYPSFLSRIFSVWFRHARVYSQNLLSNGLPPFLEPLIFLAGIGLGLGRYIQDMNGIPYLEYLASGLLVTAAMYTSVFECSFGTFIRLEFDKVYDGMLGAPITAKNLMVGEILWAGTKGLFFTFAVVIIVAAFQILPVGAVIPTPLVGFLTGIMFASMSLLVTSFVNNINHFNFYVSGLISPMFFFSGVAFPIENLPSALVWLAEALPLTHSVRLARAFSLGDISVIHLLDVGYIIAFTFIIGFIAIWRLEKRLID
jgi:lipooligosaccharide transport system permease protein